MSVCLSSYVIINLVLKKSINYFKPNIIIILIRTNLFVEKLFYKKQAFVSLSVLTYIIKQLFLCLDSRKKLFVEKLLTFVRLYVIIYLLLQMFHPDLFFSSFCIFLISILSCLLSSLFICKLWFLKTGCVGYLVLF